MKVILVRGISGSGKSTYAAAHYPGALHLEADQFRVGAYSSNQTAQANAACLAAYRAALEAGEACVVVSNAFLTTDYIEPYVQLARSMGATLEVVELRCDPATAARRNRNGVGLRRIKWMASIMEPTPRSVPSTVVHTG